MSTKDECHPNDHEQLIQLSNLPILPIDETLPATRKSFSLCSEYSNENLRLVFLFFITLIALTSFTIALIVGSAYVQFHQKCPLYAHFRFLFIDDQEKNFTIRILPASEHFGASSICDFCTFFNVLTFIYCIITGFFFVLFNGDDRVVSNNDRGLIIPWFSISMLLTLLSLINASILTNGFLQFCSMMRKQHTAIERCAQLNDLLFEQYPQVSYLFFYMFTAILASWFELTFFIGIITILTIRLS